jgi:hypothetical protein
VSLFGRKSSAAVKLELDRTDFVLGEPVAVKVTVAGERDEKVSEGRVELSYTNRFSLRLGESDFDQLAVMLLDQQTDSEDGGVDYTQPGREQTDMELMASSAFDPWPAGERTVSVALPQRGPASVGPDRVAWWVRARLERGGKDVEAAAPITVRTPPAAFAAWAEREPALDEDCPIAWRVPERTVTAGERVSGKLEIRPREDVDARGVRVELVSVDGGWRRSLAKSELAGVVSLQAMQPLELGFEVEVPDIAAPTPAGLLPSAYKGTAPPLVAPSFQAKRDNTHWFLEATVDQPKARDYRSLLELNVYNAPRFLAAPAL